MQQKRSRRKRKKRIRTEEEERVTPNLFNHARDALELTTLHHQIGNQAVQQMLAQRQVEEENAAETPIEVGEVKIEPPEIEYYEVEGNSLAEAVDQVLPPEQWVDCQYEHQPKAEDGVITQVDVSIKIKVRLPQWTGLGWDQAADDEKVEWLAMVQMMAGEADSYEETTTLPKQWLLGPAWAEANEALKSEWLESLLELKAAEKSPLDIARRRAMVLQQRLVNQPEGEATALFGQFIADLQAEDEAYYSQMQFGQTEPITLSPDDLLQ